MEDTEEWDLHCPIWKTSFLAPGLMEGQQCELARELPFAMADKVNGIEESLH